ncbi:MAG: O-antigen ligase family protein [Candidatus Omnitrophota bacterium]
MTAVFILISIMLLSPIARGAVSPLFFGSLQVLTIMALLVWFLAMFREGTLRLRRTELDAPLAVFILLAAVSIFKSPYKYDSFVEFCKMLNLAGVFYLTVNHVRERRDISRMTGFIVMLGAGLSVFGIIQYLGGAAASWWDIRDFLSSVYVNHNHFAGLLELCVPLCVGLALGEKDGGKRLLYVYAFFMMLLAFILSMSRGAWFSLMFSMPVLLALLYKKNFIKKRTFILFFIFVVIGFLFIKKTAPDLFLGRMASYRNLDLEGRLDIWKGALGIIKDNPLLGTGIGTFAHHFPRYRPEGLNLFANYAHNDYLQLASESGIVSLLAWLYMLFVIIRKGIRTYLLSESNFKKVVSLGISAGILSMAVHSMVDFNLRIPANAVLFTVLSGLLFSLSSRRDNSDRRLEIVLNKKALCVLRPLFIVFMSVWIFGAFRLVAADAMVMSARKAGLEEKLNILNRAVYLSPGNNDYYKRIARAYTSRAYAGPDREKDLFMALEYYRRASELNPIDAWAWSGVADSFSRLRDIDSAGYFYKKSLYLDPNNSYYLKKMGDLLVMLGRIDEAAEVFKRASFLEEKSALWLDKGHGKYEPETYTAKGDAYLREGALGRALGMYKLAEGLGSEEVSVKINNILGMTGKLTEAEKGLPLLKGPEEISFFNARARYLISTGAYEDADALIEKALLIDQKDPVSIQNKIDVLQKKKAAFEKVSPYIERLLALNDGAAERFMSGKNAVIALDLSGEGSRSGYGAKRFDFTLPLGLVELKIVMSGTFANGEWPHMLASVNSAPVLSAYIASASPAEFNGYGFSREGISSVSLEFTNNYWDAASGRGRDILIEKITLEYKYPDYEN